MRLLAVIVSALLAGCGGAGGSGSGDGGGLDGGAGVDGSAPGGDGGGDGAMADGGGADGAAACEPASPGGTSPAGYPLDGWTWEKRGVLWEPPAGGSGSGDIAPSLVAVGGTLHLFFTRKSGTTHRIHHATSTDGATWSVGAAPLTDLGTDSVIAYPSVLHEGGRFRMWFGSGTIDLAESTDGDVWTVVAPTVLRIGESGAFDAVSLIYPAILREIDGYRLYYTGFNGSRFAIGRADSADGTSFTRAQTTPVLEPGGTAELDNHAVAQPFALRAGDVVLLWYGAYDTSQSNPGPYRVALATSTDGLAFTKRGLTLDLAASGPDAWSTRDPTVIRTADGWLMVYCGMGDDGRYRLLRATSRTCAPGS